MKPERLLAAKTEIGWMAEDIAMDYRTGRPGGAGRRARAAKAGLNVWGQVRLCVSHVLAALSWPGRLSGGLGRWQCRLVEWR